MKFLHTGDLHIGKVVNEFSMIEDQRFFLKQILTIAQNEKVDALIIAGDVYDRSIPSAEAVKVMDSFLSELIDKGITVLLISGNHDSPERVGFANRILEKQGLHIAGMAEEGIQKVILQDTYGEVEFALLPFVKPAVVGAENNQQAVEKLLQEAGYLTGNENADMGNHVDGKQSRTVLVTHYFVTNAGKMPEVSDSETTINVGGLDNVEAETFAEFDYVALGHIHKPQQIGERPVYYAGTPIKYSFSESGQEKGVYVVTLEEKGKSIVSQIPITALHDMRKIKGQLEELIAPAVVNMADADDYLQITLTNREELIDPIGTLRSVYPNTMQLILEKNEYRGSGKDCMQLQKSKSILELYQEFYELVREEPLSKERLESVTKTIKEIEGENV